VKKSIKEKPTEWAVLCNYQAIGKVFSLTSAAVAFSGRAVVLGVKRIMK